MTPYSEAAPSLLQQLGTTAGEGLTGVEAQKRLGVYGPNRLAEKKKKSLARRFLEQFADPMILILLAAAAISFVVALQHNDIKEYFEPVLILLIVVANAIMGVTQESKAEKALDALKQLSAPSARVVRDGREQQVDSATLVPGDIVLVEAGDFIPADGRLLEAASLKCEESALTGESVPSDKDAEAEVPETAPLGDRVNMVFSGCSAAYGRGRYVVTATGMGTEVGRIAGLLNNEGDSKTPLQQKLARLSRTLGILALVISAVIFGLGLLYGMPWLEIFVTAVSLAVSAIPEGLPAIVTITLAIGVQRMVKRNAIIRRLPAVETLGSASVICSDKTGTLTQNRMTLVKAYDDKTGTLEDISDADSDEIKKLLLLATLCTDGSIAFEPDGTVKHLGDPTETAIVLAAHNNGMPKERLREKYPRIAEVPFDSDRKLMSVVCEMNGSTMLITKGAFDSIAARSTAGNLARGAQENDAMSSEALRVLAVACRRLDAPPAHGEATSEFLERDLTFLGLVGMIDPPRPEVRDAVAVCREAGIRPVMITGDHVVTASAIARDLGIQREGDRAITGAQLEEMDDNTLSTSVRDISVYARVSPEDKIRIVKAWQRQGDVVAMTGDGVNDAPALKAADIGCAMGITGTDVAKGAADMTLTDDNFTTIVDAVKEGRGIYANIRKVVAFLLGTNIGEVLTVLVSMLVWRQSPLISIQLLWINLVTDGLPAIALGREAVEEGVMQHKPRPKNEGIFAGGLSVQVVLQGVMFAALTLAAFAVGYYWGEGASLETGRTMAFIVLALTQVFHSFNMRSARSLFKIGPFSNKYLNRAALASLALMALVVFIPPVANAFALITLAPTQYLAALGLAVVPIPVLELSKAFGLTKRLNQ